MWFKHAYLFKIVEGLPASAEEFQAGLVERVLQPCPASAPASLGWVSPFGKESEVLVHSCGAYWLFGLGKEERLLPATIVREEVKQRILDIEQKFGRRVYGKEKAALRDDVQFELLSKAFVRRKQMWACLDHKAQLLILNVGADAKADEVTSFLHEHTPLRVESLEIKADLNQLLTRWVLNQEAPGNFGLAEDCVMADLEKELGRVRFLNQDLTAHDILEVAKTNRKVIELGLGWRDRIKFRLGSVNTGKAQGNLPVLKHIKFLDVIKEQQQEETLESIQQQIDSDFAIMSHELAALLKELFYRQVCVNQIAPPLL